MAVLSEQILEDAGRRPEGSLLAAKQFLSLVKRDAVDQALLNMRRQLKCRGRPVPSPGAAAAPAEASRESMLPDVPIDPIFSQVCRTHLDRITYARLVQISEQRRCADLQRLTGLAFDAPDLNLPPP